MATTFAATESASLADWHDPGRVSGELSHDLSLRHACQVFNLHSTDLRVTRTQGGWTPLGSYKTEPALLPGPSTSCTGVHPDHPQPETRAGASAHGLPHTLELVLRNGRRRKRRKCRHIPHPWPPHQSHIICGTAWHASKCRMRTAHKGRGGAPALYTSTASQASRSRHTAPLTGARCVECMWALLLLRTELAIALNCIGALHRPYRQPGSDGDNDQY